MRGYKFEMKCFFMLFKLIQIINKVGVKEKFDKIQIENVTFKICFFFAAIFISLYARGRCCFVFLLRRKFSTFVHTLL